MKRSVVFHLGPGGDHYDRVPKRYAADYGLPYKFASKSEPAYRKKVSGLLDEAAFVFVWNGLQNHTPLAVEYCKRNGVPYCVFEYGMLPQSDTFFIDPCGLVGRSKLMGELSWVTKQDIEAMVAKRELLQKQHPISDNGDILLVMQIWQDTQVLYNTPYRTMYDFVYHMGEVFGKDRIVVRPHPQGEQDYSDTGVRVQNPKTIGFLDAASAVHSVVGLTSTCLYEAGILGKAVLALGDHPMRQHTYAEHDRVCAGQLALTINRGTGRVAPIFERFGIRPLCSQPLRSES